MIKITELISGIMMRLAAIPGLSFLQTYVMSARGMRTRFGQRQGDYEAYIAAGQSAMDDVREARGQPRRSDGPQGHGGRSEESEYDEYDYEYEGDSVGADSSVEFDDDYPAADDYNSYHDDDYRSH
jgi:hypothetical protein